jgi:hypothetical protein
VDANDGANLAEDEFRFREGRPEAGKEGFRIRGIACAADHDALEGNLRLGGDFKEALDAAGAGAEAVVRCDFSVGDGDHGLDVEEGAEHGAGASDAPAAAEELEGIKEAVDVGALGSAASDGGSFSEGRTAADGFGSLKGDGTESEAGGLGINELDGDAILRHFRDGEGGGVQGAGELRRDVDGEDLVRFRCFCELVVRRR